MEVFGFLLNTELGSNDWINNDFQRKCKQCSWPIFTT
jgi:hypothetical protein